MKAEFIEDLMVSKTGILRRDAGHKLKRIWFNLHIRANSGYYAGSILKSG